MIVFHQGRFYVVTEWTHSDLQQARMVYEAREISQPEYDEPEKERLKLMRQAVMKKCGKLTEIEPYDYEV